VTNLKYSEVLITAVKHYVVKAPGASIIKNYRFVINRFLSKLAFISKELKMIDNDEKH
jgi:hypothetical protein